jgi:hypothetical protein
MFVLAVPLGAGRNTTAVCHHFVDILIQAVKATIIPHELRFSQRA